MSDATATTAVPQAPNTTEIALITCQEAAARLLPWWKDATQEQQAAVLADMAGALASDGLSPEVYCEEPCPLADHMGMLSDPDPVLLAAATTLTTAVEPEVPAKASEVYVKYAAAVQAYAVAESKGQLDTGRWAHEYILAVTKGQADSGVRRSMRASAVKRLDGELLDAGITHHSADCIRLYAVAQVLGKTEAKRLPIGKVQAFEQCLYRDKDTEAWGWKDSVTEVQQTAVRDLWARAAAAVLDCNAEVLRAEVSAALGKKPAEKKPAETPAAAATPAETVEVAPKAGEVKPAVVSKSFNPAPAGHVPEVSPENPVECGQRMASLPYGRPDSPSVWRNLGATARLSEDDARALVGGMADVGQLQALTAMAKACVAAIAKLQSAESGKSAEAARTMAPMATKSAPVAVATGPGSTTGVTVVAAAA